MHCILKRIYGTTNATLTRKADARYQLTIISSVNSSHILHYKTPSCLTKWTSTSKTTLIDHYSSQTSFLIVFYLSHAMRCLAAGSRWGWMLTNFLYCFPLFVSLHCPYIRSKVFFLTSWYMCHTRHSILYLWHLLFNMSLNSYAWIKPCISTSVVHLWLAFLGECCLRHIS